MRRVAAVSGFGAGAAVGAAALWALGPDIARPGLQRVNARGRAVATAGGVAPLASVLTGAGLTGLRRGGAWRATAVACGGLGLAGLIDDVVGEREGAGGPRGLAGHLAQLRRGRITTGAIKVAAGALSGMAAAAALPGAPGCWRMIEGGTIIALAANLGNLLDRAPGRTTKAALLGSSVLLAGGRLPVGPAFAVGATAATLPGDLAEKVMLGDTGANLVGAAVGVALVDRLGPVGRRTALALLLALTLASERWSFSTAIVGNPTLAWADGLGRRR